MYRGYKIVANSAAGRRRYMQWLVPYVIACEEIDRYDIWIHTHNGADIEFFKQLAGAFPKVNLVWQPNGEVKNISTINPFYRFCCEDKTTRFTYPVIYRNKPTASTLALFIFSIFRALFGHD